MDGGLLKRVSISDPPRKSIPRFKPKRIIAKSAAMMADPENI
jgi:hypothetical protein